MILLMSRTYEYFKEEGLTPEGAALCPCNERPLSSCGGAYGCDIDDMSLDNQFKLIEKGFSIYPGDINITFDTFKDED